MQSSKIIASLFFKMLKKDDANFKLLHHLSKRWCNQAKLLHHFFQNWCKFELEPIWKMMQSSKIIASLFFKTETSLKMLKGWCNNSKLLHYLFQNMTKLAWLLGWVGLRWAVLDLGCWAGLGLAGLVCQAGFGRADPGRAGILTIFHNVLS